MSAWGLTNSNIQRLLDEEAAKQAPVQVTGRRPQMVVQRPGTGPPAYDMGPADEFVKKREAGESASGTAIPTGAKPAIPDEVANAAAQGFAGAVDAQKRAAFTPTLVSKFQGGSEDPAKVLRAWERYRDMNYGLEHARVSQAVGAQNQANSMIHHPIWGFLNNPNYVPIAMPDVNKMLLEQFKEAQSAAAATAVARTGRGQAGVMEYEQKVGVPQKTAAETARAKLVQDLQNKGLLEVETKRGETQRYVADKGERAAATGALVNKVAEGLATGAITAQQGERMMQNAVDLRRRGEAEVAATRPGATAGTPAAPGTITLPPRPAIQVTGPDKAKKTLTTNAEVGAASRAISNLGKEFEEKGGFNVAKLEAVMNQFKDQIANDTSLQEELDTVLKRGYVGGTAEKNLQALEQAQIGNLMRLPRAERSGYGASLNELGAAGVQNPLQRLGLRPRRYQLTYAPDNASQPPIISDQSTAFGLGTILPNEVLNLAGPEGEKEARQKAGYLGQTLRRLRGLK